MKPWIPQKAILGALALCILAASSFGAAVPLRMVLNTNSPLLTADWVPEPGALFVFQTPNLPLVAANTAIFFKTNTPGTVWLPAKPAHEATSEGFFFAVHWPGRSVDEFGSPEYILDQPSPGMILITSGLPDRLAAGPVFTVDFFVTDPTGQLLNVAGPVQILVVRRVDGTVHPDAQVLPAAQQLSGGHLRAQIYVQSATSLDGYTLGIGPPVGLLPECCRRSLTWVRTLWPRPPPRLCCKSSRAGAVPQLIRTALGVVRCRPARTTAWGEPLANGEASSTRRFTPDWTS